MATARGTIFFQDDTPNLPVGAVRWWKVAFGFTTKGTVVNVAQVAAGGDVTRNTTEIPLLANGKADTNAVTAYLTGFGVSLTNALKQVIGA